MNFMVKLRNIKKNNNIYECDIWPEDSNNSGHIVVNTDTCKIEECTLPLGYEWCQNHVNHVKRVLVEMSQSKDIPNEKLVMWN